MDASMASNQYFVVALLIIMWNVDQSYMTIILNLMLSRIAGQIASSMKYLQNTGKFVKCGTITQNCHAKCVTGGNPRVAFGCNRQPTGPVKKN